MIKIFNFIFLFFLSLPIFASTDEFVYDQRFSAVDIKTLNSNSEENQPNHNWKGAFTYSLPLQIPSGRGKMHPTLSIDYDSNSDNQHSWVGRGWQLILPNISRINKTGINNIFNENYFMSSVDGELVPVLLSDSEHGIYKPKKFNSTLKNYEFKTDGSWVITESDGAVHQFGTTTSSRMDDPNNLGQIFSWFIESSEDTNNNSVNYIYVKYDNQIYPSEILYTNHADYSSLYEISFELTNNPSAVVQYDTGFESISSYLINKVIVKIGSQEVSRYELSYSSLQNNRRSLLKTVTQITTDLMGVETIYPSTSFDYTESLSATWQSSNYTSIPGGFVHDYNGTEKDRGTRVFDVNGDGLADLVHATDYEGTVSSQVYINDGVSFTQDSNYIFPVGFTSSDTRDSTDMGIRIGDVNGDGYIDLIKGRSDMGVTDGVYINDPANKTWTYSTSINGVEFIHHYSSGPKTTAWRIIDINGDNLPDLINSYESQSSSYSGNDDFYINDGTNFVQDLTYSLPMSLSECYSNSYCFDLGIGFVDINHDGLVDIIKSYDGTSEVYINQGAAKTWSLSSTYDFSNWSIVLERSSTSMPYDNGLRFIDVNRDGYLDLTEAVNDYYDILSYSNIYLSAGAAEGWPTSADLNFSIPFGFAKQNNDSYHDDAGVRIADIDGNGSLDLIKSHSTATDNGVYLATSEPSGLLTSIVVPNGGTIQVEYSTTDPSLNPNQIYPLNVVSEVTKDNGLGQTESVFFTYEGAENFFNSVVDKGFAGFSIIKETYHEKVITYYYHQGNDSNTTLGEYNDSSLKLGSIFRIEIEDKNQNNYKTEIIKWDESDGFIYPYQIIHLLYNGLSTHADYAEEYVFDTTTTNLLTKKIYGNVVANNDGSFSDTDTDSITYNYTYATDVNQNINSKISSKVLTDINGTQLSETLYYYDGQSFGVVTIGNETNKYEWISAGLYKATSQSYNSAGMIESVTDANGYTTQISYDTFGLFSEIVTNPNGYSDIYSYDYFFGKIISHINPNGFTETFVYDGLGRLLEHEQSDQITNTTMVLVAEYFYDDFSLPNTKESKNYLTASLFSQQYDYFDGFGRLVQKRKLYDGSSYFVSDYNYNEEGQLALTTLPYSSSGSSYTGLNADSTYHILLTFDPLGRKSSVTTSIGSTDVNYKLRTISITDPLMHTNDYTFDAYGQLIQVVEDIDNLKAITTYTRDVLGNLAEITDSEGIITTMVYDGLARLTSKSLPHSLNAAQINSWTYTYDLYGNITNIQTPNNDSILISYDSLNRPILKDVANDINYTYDNCANGIGKLCSVTIANGASISFEYDTHGNISLEQKTIAGTTFSTTYEYTYSGCPSHIILPDSSEIQFTFNSLNREESISAVLQDGSVHNIISNIDYAENSAVSKIEYGGGMVTEYVYDPSFLYVPSRVIATSGGVTKASVDYNYDSAVNMTDKDLSLGTSNTMKSVYTYDALNRLNTITNTENGASNQYTYTYQLNGNILESTQNGLYHYDPNHPHAVSSVAPFSYGYDNSGNMISKNNWTYQWNEFQQIVQATDGNQVFNYSYDHFGTRLQRVRSPGNHYFTTVNNYYEVTQQIQTVNIYLPGFGNLAEIRYKNGQAVGFINYHILDYQGSHLMTLDENAKILQFTNYFPFGDEIYNRKLTGYMDRRGFTGKINDRATGMIYMNARYYDPTLARFISQDPDNGNIFTPQTLNKYAYGINNPLRYSDPTGAIASDTLATGSAQMASAFVSLGQTFLSASQASASFVTGHFVQGTANTLSSLESYNSALVSGANGLNNIVNSFQDKPASTIISNTPIGSVLSGSVIDKASSTIQTVAAMSDVKNITKAFNDGKAFDAVQSTISRFNQITNGIFEAVTGNDVAGHIENYSEQVVKSQSSHQGSNQNSEQGKNTSGQSIIQNSSTISDFIQGVKDIKNAHSTH